MDGEYKVTLLIYSGLPDPVWTIGSQNEKFQQIKELLDNARAKGNIFGYKNIPPLLGFRGFLVQQSGAHGEELILGKETGDLQKLLLDTMPKESVKDNLRQKILQAIDLGAVSPKEPDATQDSLASVSSQVPSKEDKGGVGVIQHYAPKYNPDRWNKNPVILRYNNCYNYANQKITNSFAQPGYASGYYPYDITPEDLIKACESDGLVKMDVDPSAPCPKAPPQPNCLIALLVAEEVDYHCYRLDDTNPPGYWSQKLGGTPVTDLDGKGNMITDPRTAVNPKFGPDYKFVTFMKICINIIDGPLSPP